MSILYSIAFLQVVQFPYVSIELLSSHISTIICDYGPNKSAQRPSESIVQSAAGKKKGNTTVALTNQTLGLVTRSFKVSIFT